ncbi:MAG: AAA family ATPase [Faecalibacterium prausnitzii]
MGGNNNQGKTSVLDALAWALGGENSARTPPSGMGPSLPPTSASLSPTGSSWSARARTAASPSPTPPAAAAASSC